MLRWVRSAHNEAVVAPDRFAYTIYNGFFVFLKYSHVA